MKTLELIACLMGIAVISDVLSQDTDCGHIPADVVFILDESSSIYPGDFGIQKDFVAEYVDNFDKDLANFGIITFSDDSRMKLNLGQRDRNGRKIDAADVAKKLKQQGGNTYTWRAINEMTEKMKFRGGDTPKICIVITDGQSHNFSLTVAAARKAKQQGITMFAIGINCKQCDESEKPKYREELRLIANSPSSIHLFELESYDELIDRAEEILKRTCPPPPNIQGCKDSGPKDIVWSVPADLDIADMGKTLLFVNDATKSFNISMTNMQVGVAASSCNRFDSEIGLSRHDTYSGFSKDVNKRKRVRETPVAQQLASVVENINGHLENEAQKVGILIVDGAVSDPEAASEQAMLAEYDGLELLVIGVRTSEAELKRDIGDNIRVLLVDNFNKLEDLKGDLLDLLCKMFTNA